MGRPSDYSETKALRICALLAEGQSLRSICRAEDMPAISTVFLWLAAHDEFSEHYARAREAQADALADEIVDIADDGSRDYTKTEDGREVVDHDHITRSRLRVDARKWIASKLKPRKYGDRTALTGAEGEPLIPAAQGSDLELARRIAFLLDAGMRAVPATVLDQSAPESGGSEG